MPRMSIYKGIQLVGCSDAVTK